jgi:hypothetical protein
MPWIPTSKFKYFQRKLCKFRRISALTRQPPDYFGLTMRRYHPVARQCCQYLFMPEVIAN